MHVRSCKRDQPTHTTRACSITPCPTFKSNIPAQNLHIAILQLDRNFHDAHQDALYYLYNFVPVGGYVILDDLLVLPNVTGRLGLGWVG